MPNARLAAALGLLLSIVSGSARGARGDPVEPPRLNFQPASGLEPAAARLALIDRAALLHVMRLVGAEHAGIDISVVLASEDSGIGEGTPSWIVGFADGAAGTIVLFPSRSPSYPHNSLEDVLLHEVAHVLITRAAGGAFVPRWFDEGLALAAERASGFQDRARLMMAIALDRRSIGDLDASFSAGPHEAARAYALAGALVRDVLRRHGSDAAARILSRLAAGENFEQGLRAVTGQTLSGLERVFWRRGWWYHVVPFMTSSAVLWVAVAFLALYARSIRVRRRAALRRRWDQEEEVSIPAKESDREEP